MDTHDATEQALADLSSGQYDHVLLDFDQTLFLDNSTERYLDSLRPRLLAFLLVAATDWFVRAYAWFGLCSYNNQRDFTRVLVCTVLMPWHLLRWPVVAKRFAKNQMNQQLLDTLPPDKPLIILSFGFHHIIHPILHATGLSKATLICSRTGPHFENLRVSGKPAALKKYAPHCVLERALFLTDSEDDDDVVQSVAKAHVTEWCPPTTPAFKGYYLPMRYTVEGKYANRRYFTYQIVQEDFVLLLLAYSFSLPHVVSLWFLFLSLYAIYEIGYYENDHVAAAREAKPIVSDAAHSFASHPRFKPWVWAFLLGLVGIVFALDKFPLVVSLVGWFGILAGGRLIFFAFNRLAPKKRTIIFPLLHILKTFSFVLFIPLTLLGALLLAAQVMSISINYIIYRFGDNLARFNRQAWRLILFMALVGIVFAVDLPATLSSNPVRFGLIVTWGSVRAVENAKHQNIVRIIGGYLKKGLPRRSQA